MFDDKNAPSELPDRSDKLWRYMDLTKFVSLLDSKSLYFRRSDKFEDKFEGAIADKNLVQFDSYLQNVVPDIEHASSLSQFSAQFRKNFRKLCYVNCWHKNQVESEAMWGLYLKGADGVAIQTSFNGVIECLNACKADVTGGLVRYINYDSDFMESKNQLFDRLVYKRKSFEHEKEFRLLHAIKVVGEISFSDETQFPLSVNIDVQLEKLIEKIYISPTCEAWFADLVRSLVKQYGFDFEIVQSDLKREPSF